MLDYKSELREIASTIQRPDPTKRKKQYTINDQWYARCTKILEEGVPKPWQPSWLQNTNRDAVYSELMKHTTADNMIEFDADSVIDITHAVQAYPKTTKAIDWGVEAHNVLQQAIEARLDGELMWDAGDFNHVLHAFTDFEKEKDIEWLATEMVVWAANPRIAGSVDAIARGKVGDEEGLIVIDWKTVNLKTYTKWQSQYETHAMQVGMYSHMVEHCVDEGVIAGYVVYFPQEPPPEDVPLFRVRKVQDLGKMYQKYLSAYDISQVMSGALWE